MKTFKVILLVTLIGFMSGCAAKDVAVDSSGSNVDEKQVSEIEGDFSYDMLDGVMFEFSSGAGGWGTFMSVDSDGSFTGDFHDSDMGAIEDEYPNGTVYLCAFSGKFSEPEMIDEYTYKVRIEQINYENEPETEEIKDGVKYIYSTAYGLDGGEDFYFYLPGKPVADLSEGFKSWVQFSIYDYETETELEELDFVGLYNESMEQGFSSYNSAEY